MHLTQRALDLASTNASYNLHSYANSESLQRRD